MPVENGKTYRIKGDSEYFKDKYGTPNPDIRVEGTDEEVFGGSWGDQKGNPACLLYAIRAGFGKLPLSGQVYYGKINGLGELVHESELETTK